MTRIKKARALFGILDCASMGLSRPTIMGYAKEGNVEAIWSYYTRAIARRPDVGETVASGGGTSFEMLQPAMEAVYQLPLTEAIES